MLIPGPRTRRVAACAIWILTLAPAAWAGDLCIDSVQGGKSSLDQPLIVGRSFKIPKNNKCKAFHGILVGERSAVTGSACTSFDGGQVTFVLTAVTISNRALYSVTLTLPSRAGSLWKLDGDSAAGFDAIAYECKSTYPDNL